MKAKKLLLAAMAVVLIVTVSVAGTLAFLSQSTNTPLTNTFIAAGGGKLIDDDEPIDPTDPTVKGFFLVEHEVEYKDNNYVMKDPETFVKANDYGKVAPNMALFKDPMLTVNVETGAEVYIFVKASSTLNSALTFTMTGDWTALGDGVYVYKNAVVTGVEGVELNGVQLLAGNKVIVNNVTSFGELTDGKLGTLEFSAYVCQSQGFASAADAWTACFATP